MRIVWRSMRGACPRAQSDDHEGDVAGEEQKPSSTPQSAVLAREDEEDSAEAERQAGPDFFKGDAAGADESDQGRDDAHVENIASEDIAEADFVVTAHACDEGGGQFGRAGGHSHDDDAHNEITPA